MKIQKQPKIKLFVIFALSAAFVLLSFYFYNFIQGNTYLGIKVTETGNRIERIYVGGVAAQDGLKVGDRLLSIDNEPASTNTVLNKWLIVEQAQEVTVERGGVQKEIRISNKGNMSSHFLYMFLSALVFFVFFMSFLRKRVLHRSTLYFVEFGLSLILLLLAVIPSSMGESLGRVIVFSFLTAAPLFLHYFAFNLYLENLSSWGKKIRYYSRIFLITVASVATSISIVYIFFFESHTFASTFVPGLFYYLGLSIITIASVYTWGIGAKINRPISRLNFPLIVLLSFAPFFLFYLLPTPWVGPYSVVIPFFLLPLACILYPLLLLRTVSYKVIRFRILVTLFIAVVVIFLGFLMSFIPASFVFIYTCLLLYFLFPLIEELFMVSNPVVFNQREIAIFVVSERERENISLLLHDTIIQDIIFEMKKIETDNEAPSKKEILNLLEDNVYQLRELCSNIYPLMIREKGLNKTLNSALNKVQKNQSVEIEISFPKGNISLGEKEDNFVLRTLLELVNNSIKHGKATHVAIEANDNSKSVVFSVKDNGSYQHPLEDSKKHFGLELIKEKLLLLGGNLVIDLTDGTNVIFTVPKVKEKG